MGNKAFEKSEWIWSDKGYNENEYAEFYEKIICNGGTAKLRLSVGGDYTVFINGKYVASNQYSDFPHYKIYDELDISEFLQKGENVIFFLAWYLGKSSQRYYIANAGLIYELEINGEIIAFSGRETKSRKSRAYKSNNDKKITSQLGYSFTFDETKNDSPFFGNAEGFSFSHKITEKTELYLRPIKKHDIGCLIEGKISKTDFGYIVDLGKEAVGYLAFSLESEKIQKINIAYGEVLENGRVKRIIGDRDFSVDYIAKSGKNEFANYMLKLACRYLEITCDFPVSLEYIGILPLCYPVEDRKIELFDDLDTKIYEISLNTLKLCMLDHYTDCPWREQCLYTFDSRNQMLFGYKAFENGNFEYARANLLLISKDRRDDGLLSICYPSGEALAIPSFSFWYALEVKEYIDYSGDLSLGEEVIEKIESVLKVFVDNMTDGLINKFTDEKYWNFYDWSYSKFFSSPEEKVWSKLPKNDYGPDFLLNCIAVIALNSYGDICKKLKRQNLFEGLSQEIASAATKKYFNPENGLFFIADKMEEPSELENSLAVFSGIAKDDIAENICERLSENKLKPCSLSTKFFKFEALIKTNKEKYKNVVLDEIRQTYKIMLDEGSTTVWETIEGKSDFENAGSLCHGWSSTPIYYYNTLKGDC